MKFLLPFRFLLNVLPNETWYETELSVFQSQLKTYLLQKKIVCFPKTAPGVKWTPGIELALGREFWIKIEGRGTGSLKFFNETA